MPNPISPFFERLKLFSCKVQTHSTEYFIRTLQHNDPNWRHRTHLLPKLHCDITGHSPPHSNSGKCRFLTIETFTIRSRISKYKMAPGSRKPTRSKNQWRSRSVVERKCAILSELNKRAAAIVPAFIENRVETSAGCEFVERRISQNFFSKTIWICDCDF